MKTVILEVRSLENSLADVAHVWKTGKAECAARISFASPELLWAVFTANRWEILKVMIGAGPLGVRELARCVKRDVKGVHNDITALCKAGIIDRTDDGKLLFPYENIEVKFMLHSAPRSRVA